MTHPTDYLIDAKLPFFKDEVEVHYESDENGNIEIHDVRLRLPLDRGYVNVWEFLSDKGQEQVEDEFLVWVKAYQQEQLTDSTRAYNGKK